MSQNVVQTELQEKTQRLVDGPLKHIRAAALAAALLPLASVVATPASAQNMCASGGTACGVVWNDTNTDGIQDADETGIEGAKVFLNFGSDTLQAETGPTGFYSFDVPDGTFAVAVPILQGTEASPANVGDDTYDSDGTPDGFGYSVATVTVLFGNSPANDFGFFTRVVSEPPPPGTGTPGYWKNHPDAWPVTAITVGGRSYSKDEAITWLGKVGKDKTATMFSSLVPAMLNVLIGNEDSCVSSTIADANDWMAIYGPVGSNVAASSDAWTIGEPMHRQMDSYNNGLLCAPHRQ